jgi:hypothetical protein
MAEFFSDCIKKIKSRLVATIDSITKVENFLKNENRTMYHKVIENSFSEHHLLDLKAEEIDSVFEVLIYYYGCTSIKNVGEVKIRGDSGGDNGRKYRGRY